MKQDNKGYSLIELIVIVLIMAIVTSTVAIGISTMHSRDATRVASVITATLERARVEAMSREDSVNVTVMWDNSEENYNCILWYGDSSITAYNDVNATIIKEDSMGSGVTISAELTDISGITSYTRTIGEQAGDRIGITVTFSKSSGSYQAFDDGLGAEAYYCDELTVQASKTAVISLVRYTGRSYTTE